MKNVIGEAAPRPPEKRVAYLKRCSSLEYSVTAYKIAFNSFCNTLRRRSIHFRLAELRVSSILATKTLLS